jgi:5-hydroxyisourate hydrolase
MPGISIHVVDVSRGVVAAGLHVALHGPDGALIAKGTLAANGTLDDPVLAQTFAPGVYRATFHVAAYYRAAGVTLATVPFLDVVTYDFGIADAAQHYHLPFKCTPWGFSCFRGGA